MEYLILWPFFCVLVGWLANSRGRSGFGFFLVSLLLSPLIGLIIVLVITDLTVEAEKERVRREGREQALASIKAIAQPQADNAPQIPIGSSIADEILKLGELQERGLLTNEEFQVQKGALLKHGENSAAKAPDTPHPQLSDAELMEKYDITSDGEKFRYGQYRYDSLADAVRYARQQDAKRG